MARTPSKPHIPYRGDDPAVGKKTGLKIPSIPRRSDGYEPFNDLLSQAVTPPPRPKKKRVSEAEEEDEDEEDDEFGEASMDVDSPVNYSTTPRAATSSRPVARDISPDFDTIPAPRARKSVGRAGPSHLSSRELLEQDEDEDDGGMDNYDQQDDFGGQEEEEEPVKPPTSKGKGKAAPSPPPTPKRRGKLSHVDEEEEEEIARGMEDVASEEEEEERPPPKKRIKGTPAPAPKAKEIAHEMEDVDQGASEDEEEEERPPPKKRIKATPAPASKPKVIRTRPLQKENRDDPEGVRRSQRIPYPPLEYWRGERRVYGPRDPGQKRQVPHITEIIRLPKEPPAPPRAAAKRKRARSRTTEETEVIEREVIVEIDASNPENGWDDDTDPNAVVLDYRSGKPVSRRVAFLANMFNPTPANVKGADDAWAFQKIFGDGDFMAAGQLIVPVGKRKPSKGTKDNTYIFYVVEGAVSVVIGETSLVLATGGMFMVPRGNSYFIENIADRDAKLFFTQARKIREDEGEQEEGASAGPQVSARSASTVSAGRQ
ncbi:CENP-C-C domain-containing protein [Mycena sanguinolenta]|uniref:CENP-C homolog n=1 Tax=Mycena sanguinolenta TaxID=230812 RepID=A0A8H7DAH3_9AGAR|nr:CENP-C-C domain-containing protein [Mycena sanguinolenta]